MRAFVQTAFLAAGLSGLSGIALAADPIRPVVPIVVPPFSWTGAYIGVQGGWDDNRLETDLFGGESADANGGLFGIFAGYNWAFGGAWGNWVVGIDGSINWANARATTTSPGGWNIDAGPTWKGFIRGRLGLAWDRLLLYGTLGGVAMNFEETNFGLGSNTPWGWTAGLGADWAITNNVFLRLDWAHQWFDTSTVGGVSYTNDADSVTFGIAYKF